MTKLRETRIFRYVDIVFIETPDFIRKVDRLATVEEMFALERELIENPHKGKLIRGAGGARKIRMKVGDSGKSGGARVIYYYVDMRGEVWFLDIYQKPEKEEVEESEKRYLYRFIKETIP